MLTGSDQASVTVGALLDNAKRLGLLPAYKTGTIFADATTDGRAMVTLDNDTAPVPAFNYAGPLASGHRVITIAIPPHGLYIIGAIAPSALPVVETFAVTGTATYTKPSGLIYVDVEVQAGGGAGGGATATGVGQWSTSDGGGGGEYARGIFLAGSLGATETVTIGQGGIAASGASGTAGGGSSFGSLITTIAGGGGTTRAATNTANFTSNTQTRSGGAGGTGGTYRVAGSPGGMGIGIGSATTGVRAGDGGQSFLAGGRVESLNIVGGAGRLYGGGGAGAATSASQSAVAGGAGGDGIVIVTSYFA